MTNFSMRRAAVALLLIVASPASVAQEVVTDPSAQQIIDALKPKRPITFRNLQIKKADQAALQSESQGGATTAPADLPEAGGTGSPPVSATSPAPAAKPRSIDIAIQFDLGSSRVSPLSEQTLRLLATALADPQLDALRFRIEGHTDSTGRAEANVRLSQARADEVKRVLVGYHIAPERLMTVGKGSSEPINTRDTTAAANRRVRFVSMEQ